MVLKKEILCILKPNGTAALNSIAYEILSIAPFAVKNLRWTNPDIGCSIERIGMLEKREEDSNVVSD